MSIDGITNSNVSKLTCAVTSNSSVPIGNATNVQYTFPSPILSYDPSNIYDGAGNFTPNVAGNYLVTAQIRYTDDTGGTARALQMYLNGSLYNNFTAFWTADPSVGRATPIVTCTIPCNGTTDSISIYGYQDSGDDLYMIWGVISIQQL